MNIAVIGLGYVGIQLAVALGCKHRIVGFDVNKEKLKEYQAGVDPAGEVSSEQIRRAVNLTFTDDPSQLSDCGMHIVAVPTPVDDAKAPSLEALVNSSQIVGKAMCKGSVVVYESTVYPGATEEVCVPILESSSGLQWQEDFHVGYSPERINPGDPEHTLQTIMKLVSADDEATLDLLEDIYGSIVDCGVYRVSSIRVAEAAKVIENTQRDLNIALVNELAIIFDRLEINTADVLDAASTKWNIIPFKPGLVGGHCIGVDPYYLTYKSQMVDYHPEVILSGRRINDSMAHFVASKTVQLMGQQGLSIAESAVNVFGLTFKENCTDIRNSQVVVLVKELQRYGISVTVVDPLADPHEVATESGLVLTSIDELNPEAVGILAVPHKEFVSGGVGWIQSFITQPGLLVDINSTFRLQVPSIDHLTYWSL